MDYYAKPLGKRKHIAVVWNIPVAGNRASADFIFSSPLMSKEYQRTLPDYDNYANRTIILNKE